MAFAYREGLSPEALAADRIAAQESLPLAADIVRRVLHLSVQKVTPLLGLGSVNLIFVVETACNAVIVRLSKPTEDAAAKEREYEKERWCLRKAAEAGIPSPEVLAVGKENDRAFLLQNRVPGVNGAHSSLPRETLYRTLGVYARRIHASPTRGFGDDVAGFESGDAREGWLRTGEYHLASLTAEDPLIALGVYSANQQDAIREAFACLFRLPLRVGLNHGDLTPANTVVDESGRVTLLDWGCAEMQVVPHYEFYAFLRRHDADASSLAAFREGYGMTDAQWADLQPEIVLFSLLKAFDLTRWAIDRCSDRIPELSQRARRHWDAYREHGTTPDQSPDVPTK